MKSTCHFVEMYLLDTHLQPLALLFLARSLVDNIITYLCKLAPAIFHQCSKTLSFRNPRLQYYKMMVGNM